MLMRNYKFNIALKSIDLNSILIEDYLLFFSLLWFFFYAFTLLTINAICFQIGEKLFNTQKNINYLFIIVITTFIAYMLFNLHPFIEKKYFTTILGETPNPMELKKYFSSIEKKNLNKPFPFLRYPFITEHLFILITTNLSFLVIKFIEGKQRMMLDLEKLKREKLQTSYNALVGQINPHFFFNSLNGLNSLVRNDEKEKTLKYTEELSNIFRYILQSNHKGLVTLGEEFQFIKAYVYLLSVRYEEKLFFSIQINSTYLLWYLPILSVLPIIENAVKHNTISKQYPLHINIHTNDKEQLIISNRIQPKIEAYPSNGFGLKNLQERYLLLTNREIIVSKEKDFFTVILPLINTPKK